MASKRVIYFSRDYTPHDHRFLSVLAHSPYDVAYLRLEDAGRNYEMRPLPTGIQAIPWRGGCSTVGWRDGLCLLPELKHVIRDFQPHLIHAGPLQRSAFMTTLAGFHPLISMSWGYDLFVEAHQNTLWAFATRFTLRRSDWLIADCNTIRQCAIQYGMPAEQIVTFPWGVDIDVFSPLPAGKTKAEHPLRKALGWGEDTFVLLSTRSWAPLYGIEELAQAFVYAYRRNPSLRLFMLGSGPQTQRIQAIFQNGLGKCMNEVVVFPGQLIEGKLCDYYRAADLYVSASHSDGSSISLLEALACACPVLVSDLHGNQEWVQQNLHGWCFRMGDVDALQAAILHALESRESLPEMARAARLLAEQRANWKHHAAQLLKLYEITLKETTYIK